MQVHHLAALVSIVVSTTAIAAFDRLGLNLQLHDDDPVVANDLYPHSITQHLKDPYYAVQAPNFHILSTAPPTSQIPEKAHKGLQQKTATGSSWMLQDTFQGKSFFDQFTFFSEEDPTHGFVQYVDQPTAESMGLVQFQDDAVIIKADNHTVTPDGRSSVRISSHHAYKSGLFLFDIGHMPIGCGQWPAVWLLGPDWPNGGEIDIVEGINTQTRNLMTLHTSEGCTQAPHANQTGNTVSSDCDVNAPDQTHNQGCTVEDNSRESFGYKFNKRQGGVFAVEWLPTSGIRIWDFQRNSIPADIETGQPDPDSWPKPSADFPFGELCSSDFFGKLNIVINLTFCGDWAGNAELYHHASCPGDCVPFVKNNPDKFNEAFWRIYSIKVYALAK